MGEQSYGTYYRWPEGPWLVGFGEQGEVNLWEDREMDMSTTFNINCQHPCVIKIELGNLFPVEHIMNRDHSSLDISIMSLRVLCTCPKNVYLVLDGVIRTLKSKQTECLMNSLWTFFFIKFQHWGTMSIEWVSLTMSTFGLDAVQIQLVTSGYLRNLTTEIVQILVNSTVELCDSADYKSKGKRRRKNK